MKKTTKTTICFLFLIFTVNVLSVANAANIWEKRKQRSNIKSGTEDTQKQNYTSRFNEKETAFDAMDPEAIAISNEYGTIIETHAGTNGQLIVHIQDAHMNYEAQKNEASILRSLIEDYGINLVLLEGRFTEEDFSYVRDRALLHERAQKADNLLKQGYINGVDYLSIASNYDIAIRPIEEKELYVNNINSLWVIDTFKERADRIVSRFIVTANNLKTRIYNNDLKELDMKKMNYDTEKIDLLEYYEYMFRKAKETEVPLYTFPNFTNLVRASELEKKIDLVKVRNGSASDEDMSAYSEYLELTESLNISDLFKEEPLLEGVLRDVMADTYEQKKLFRISKALSILKNLLRIKVVPEEYKYFQENKRDFDPKAWVEFFEEKTKELNIVSNIPTDYSIISDNIPKIEKFYGLAFERNQVFLKKTEEHLLSRESSIAILVAGGFHTPALTRLLKDSGYSYVVISPKVASETRDDMYRTALKRGTQLEFN